METKQHSPEEIGSEVISMKLNQISEALIRRIRQLNPALFASRMPTEEEMRLYGPALERPSVKKQLHKEN